MAAVVVGWAPAGAVAYLVAVGAPPAMLVVVSAIALLPGLLYRNAREFLREQRILMEKTRYSPTERFGFAPTIRPRWLQLTVWGALSLLIASPMILLMVVLALLLLQRA